MANEDRNEQLVVDVRKNQVTAEEMTQRISELEQALEPFARAGVNNWRPQEHVTMVQFEKAAKVLGL